MNISIQAYVEDLFKGYEENQALKDFKEEILTNLQERVQDLQKKGLSPDEAFTNAVAELGDITSIADQISRQKRNEIIERMYINPQTKVGMKHALGYVLAGTLGLFGVLAAFITYFSTGQIAYGVSTLIPFIILSGTAFVFLGLTQETARNLPMSWKRALVYALTTGLILFGLITSAMMYFMEERTLQAVLGTLIPFALPGLAILAFLILTEKNRHKPWVIEEQKILMEHYTQKYSDPQRLEQHGLLSGALWILAIALFIVLGMVISFKYSWVVFIFAVAVQLLIEFWMYSRKK